MIRNWLVECRNILNCTHQKIADDCNITRPYYTQIELGTRNPSVAVAKKIAERMGFNWTIFFKEECNKTKHEDQHYREETCNTVNSKLAG